MATIGLVVFVVVFLWALWMFPFWRPAIVAIGVLLPVSIVIPWLVYRSSRSLAAAWSPKRRAGFVALWMLIDCAVSLAGLLVIAMIANGMAGAYP